MNDRILVPHDGSQAADRALAKACQLAKSQGMGLDLLHVIDTRQFHVGYAGAAIDGRVLYNAEQRAEVALKDVARPLLKEGLDVRVHLRFGSPRTVIALDAPKAYDTGLIVLGRSSQRAVARLFMGSVASFVTEHAPCDVLVVT